jgi:peptidoglycan/LPS O-acetylase OafA/YrhL
VTSILSKPSSGPEAREKVFFPGLNALRFFAALCVIISHIELIKGSFGFKHYWNNVLIFNLGGLGVYFFFVLSGFLITFLLLKEKEQAGAIRIRQFYLRRILRIWPLYYAICILGFFILPYFKAIAIPYLREDFQAHFGTNLVLYLLILPNLAFSLYQAVPHIGQTWSIGVEEQFYLGWPWLIAKAKNVFRSLLIVIGLIVLLKVLVLLLGNFFGGQDWYPVLKRFVAMSKFECMAIGGIGAYFLYTKNEKILRYMCDGRLFWLSLLGIPLLIYFTPAKIQDSIHLVYSVLFLIIIMYISGNTRIAGRLETRYFSYLGKISYGIYMYHFIIIPIVMYLYNRSGLELGELSCNLILYTAITGLTILVSGLSYALFEERFIRLKDRFTVIRSGMTAGEKER